MELPEYRISHVQGFFEHDTQPIGPDGGFRATTRSGLGLLNRSYPTDTTFDGSREDTGWLRFLHWLQTANEEQETTLYKLLVVVRHGEAEHNVKEHEVERQAWESHWAKLDGDNRVTWADASLTPQGENEALDLGRFWSLDMSARGVAFPERLYSSPLTRCLQTVSLAHQGLGKTSEKALSIHVAEGLRETLGVHTCDRRSTRSVLQKAFPEAIFNDDFTEKDELWQAAHRETVDESTTRLRTWLQALFQQDDSQLILVAAHSGSIRALHRAAGHPDIWPARGSMNPLLLKARKEVR